MRVIFWERAAGAASLASKLQCNWRIGMFENKVAVVTGGAHGIGKCICEEFEKAGAKVCTIDLQENP